MPDLVTHVTAAYFLSCRRSERFRVIFYLGTILPDIAARPIHILFPKLYFFTIGIHTPVFMILLSLLLAEFFHKSIKNLVFRYLIAGVFLHFFMDFFQRHLTTGYYWFYPFSWHSFEVGLFWPETPVRLIPLWVLLICGTELLLWMRKRATPVEN